MSQETRDKISAAHKGKKASVETKEKMSLAQKGHRRGGWSFTEEQRKKFQKIQLEFTRSGRRTHNWKGGITPIAQKIRKTLEYRIWRESCLKRDNYTCQNCNKVGGNLNVDHYPWSFSSIIEFTRQLYPNTDIIESVLSFYKFSDIDNGRTLCVQCHKEIGWRPFKKDNLQIHA